MQAFWGNTPDKLPEGKSIFSLDGRVSVNGRRANTDTQINAGDTVTTGRNSEVVFAVGSDSFILRSNSEMEIEGGGFFVSALRMLTGSMLGVFGKRAGSDSLNVSTGIATIGIRGTGLYVEAEPDLSCYAPVTAWWTWPRLMTLMTAKPLPQPITIHPNTLPRKNADAQEYDPHRLNTPMPS